MTLLRLRFSPIQALLSAGDPAIDYFTRRDLLGEDAGPASQLWMLPVVMKAAAAQRDDGAWGRTYAKRRFRSPTAYDQYETYRVLNRLVSQFGLTREHPAASGAAEYFYTWQTADGDFRGIYAGQYASIYSAAISELLAKAGYVDCHRNARSFEWLLKMRQDDGGWATPLRTVAAGASFRKAFKSPEAIEPDRSKPFWKSVV